MDSNKINILFTGLSGSDSSLQPLINSNKINFVHFPTIEIGESELTREEKNTIKEADSYDYIVFTSVNAVKYLLLHYDNNLSKFNCKTKIVAIGKKTASLLLKNGIDVDLIPSNSSSNSIDELLTQKLVHEKSILIPGSKLSRADLFASLQLKGALVDFIVVYENIIPKNILDITKNGILNTRFNLIVFTSPSTFYNFISIFEINDVQAYFANKLIAAIGPVTEAAIEKHNLKVNILPSEYNLYSLTKEIINYYKIN